ncbi:MAG: formylglycine-generating enzyme family protein [bacterium]|nr:formylglycine-generating enzyme family protein [bacterium]
MRLAIALAMKGKSERTQSVELFIRHLTESSNEETVNLHDQEPKKPQPAPKKPNPAPKINQSDKEKKSKSLYIWGIGGAVALALLIGIIKFCGRSSGGEASPETSDSTAMVDTYYANGVSFEMVRVEGGTFTMGATAEQGSDASEDEKPAHQVTLSSYMIGKTEVTQELWEAVMGKSVSQIASELGYSTYGEGADYPMYFVSWEDCQAFITKLNALTGKNFRLPTEAEWEFAARGGINSQGFKYSGSNTIDDVAWYDDSTTHPVATKASNELGIYDMSGNVWEWCNDWKGSYTSTLQTNPTGTNRGLSRVNRGGSWYNDAIGCRVSYRNNNSPTYSTNYLGLRLAL